MTTSNGSATARILATKPTSLDKAQALRGLFEINFTEKIMAVYEANNQLVNDVDHAVALVERAGHGTVVKFIEEHNMPFCLPETILRSIALWTYDGAIWRAVSLYSGYADILREERPS